MTTAIEWISANGGQAGRGVQRAFDILCAELAARFGTLPFTFAEIGVGYGEMAAALARQFPAMRYLGVDSFDYRYCRAFDVHHVEPGNDPVFGYEMCRQESWAAVSRMPCGALLQMDSNEAARLFAPAAIDVVHWGNYDTHPLTIRDMLHAWYPAARHLLCGMGFCNYGTAEVMRAHEIIRRFAVDVDQPLYVDVKDVADPDDPRPIRTSGFWAIGAWELLPTPEVVYWPPEATPDWDVRR